MSSMREKLEIARALVAQSASIVSFSGAGLSAESGIPVFRTAKSSSDKDEAQDDSEKPLWEKFDPQQLASQAGFAANPQLVQEWYAWRRSELANAKPNAAHTALAARKSILHVTQNVDDLLERAGAEASSVVHVHGELSRNTCNAHCGYSIPIELSGNSEDNMCTGVCPECGSDIRPGVVWFGEALPEAAWEQAASAVSRCDLLIVVGTSAMVYPAAGLIDLARQNGAGVVIIDPDFIGAQETSGENSQRQEIVLPGTAGDVLPYLLKQAD